ncbi:MAG: ribose 5-phosphate isomerase B [Paludibacteraceae bacterium]|nr:ribose 5-phosphate isomerase B [Paludibacteraceae bacterium]
MYNIALASDHAGYLLKKEIEQFLLRIGYTVHDFGCPSVESCDYPDYAHPMAAAVEKGEYDCGIAICSTGNGITMTCNHHAGIRAALCWDPSLAELARKHNNANVLGLPANFVDSEEAMKIVHTFLTTPFEGGRHERRIRKIPC